MGAPSFGGGGIGRAARAACIMEIKPNACSKTGFMGWPNWLCCNHGARKGGNLGTVPGTVTVDWWQNRPPTVGGTVACMGWPATEGGTVACMGWPANVGGTVAACMGWPANVGGTVAACVGWPANVGGSRGPACKGWPANVGGDCPGWPPTLGGTGLPCNAAAGDPSKAGRPSLGATTCGTPLCAMA